MKRSVLALALCLALLAGCGEPENVTASSPEPQAQGEGGVAVHWDVLETPAPGLANRRYEAYTDTLIPADDYGALVPYLGGEVSLGNGVLTTWFYGLATRGGEIVTDPAYLDVSGCQWFDRSTGTWEHAGALVLQSAAPVEIGEDGRQRFELRCGVCAADGSWYTGQRFTLVAAMSSVGLLCIEDTGDAVMLDYSGGELWRWAAREIPLPHFRDNEYVSSNFSVWGEYLCYVEGWDSYGRERVRYVDARTGEVYGYVPEDLVSDGTSDGFSRGTGASFLETEDGVIVRPDSGGEYLVEAPEASGGFYANVNGDRVLFNYYGGPQVLTDLEGVELARWEDGRAEFMSGDPDPDSPTLLRCVVDEFDEDAGYHSATVTIYDRSGRELLRSDGAAFQFLDRLLIADGGSYRLTDLEGRDLIRISRWEAMDIPMEE